MNKVQISMEIFPPKKDSEFSSAYRVAKELADMGVDYIGVHTGVDMQKAGRTPLKDLEELILAVDSAKTAVAGGVKIDTIDAYAALEAEIIIAGGALCHAENIRQAAIDMKGHIK